jgi:hypothetical protein
VLIVLVRREQDCNLRLTEYRNNANRTRIENLLNLRTIAKIRNRSEQYQWNTRLPTTNQFLNRASRPTGDCVGQVTFRESARINLVAMIFEAFAAAAGPRPTRADSAADFIDATA